MSSPRRSSRGEENLYNWQRSAADFANFKRRTEEERSLAGQFSNALLIGKLLAVLDDFDRALESVPPDAEDPWIEGVKLVERKLRNVLESEGVTPDRGASASHSIRTSTRRSPTRTPPTIPTTP